MRVLGECGITSGGTSSQGAVGEREYGVPRGIQHGGKRRAGAMEGRGIQSLGEGGTGWGLEVTRTWPRALELWPEHYTLPPREIAPKAEVEA